MLLNKLRKAWKMLRSTASFRSDNVIMESERLRHDIRVMSYRLNQYTEELKSEVSEKTGGDNE